MRKKISGSDERMETEEKLNNESEYIFGISNYNESDIIQINQDTTSTELIEPEPNMGDGRVSVAPEIRDDADDKTRPSLASHHRTHHHHHHHSHYRIDSGEAEFVTISSDLAEAGSLKEAEENYLVDERSVKEEAVTKKRIPLAAHHRTHRHHRSGEHTHRSRRKSKRSSSVSKAHNNISQENEIRGQIETIEIDGEEFARLHNESLKEMDSNKTIAIDQDSATNETRILPKVELESVSGAESPQDQESTNSTARLGATILAAREANPRATRKASSIKSVGSRSRQKKANARTIIVRILIGIVAVLVGCIVILLLMRAHGKSSMTPNGDDVEIVMSKEKIPEDADVEDAGKTVIYKGQKYRWNENLTTFLILGTDRTLEQQASGETVAGKNGQADTILLAVIDNTNKKISFININRDTFIPIAEYSSDGDYAGEKKMQICLSYAYGKDNETSCRYTAEAVSKFLYGMPVDYYVRLSYDAIQVLNDSVGGVTLTVGEDLTMVDPSLSQGATVTLVGSQAMTYVRWRNKNIVETNENRISRQKQYLYSFMNRTIECTRGDLLLPFGLYANAKPYMTTNVTPSQLTYITSKVLEYGVPGDSIHSIPGKSVEGDENHVEFYPDQTALYEQILDTFYNKVT